MRLVADMLEAHVATVRRPGLRSAAVRAVTAVPTTCSVFGMNTEGEKPKPSTVTVYVGAVEVHLGDGAGGCGGRGLQLLRAQHRQLGLLTKVVGLTWSEVGVVHEAAG